MSEPTPFKFQFAAKFPPLEPAPAQIDLALGLKAAVSEFRRTLIVEALRLCNHNHVQAARLLRISVPTAYRYVTSKDKVKRPRLVVKVGDYAGAKDGQV